MIVSVGCRVNSTQATSFRIWATELLKEYSIEGFTNDDESLKNPNKFLATIILKSSLRAQGTSGVVKEDSTKRLLISTPNAVLTIVSDQKRRKIFFATVQNKLYGAITGQTPAETIKARVNSTKENMGLTTWNNAPKFSH
jgi:hypothetical protein